LVIKIFYFVVSVFSVAMVYLTVQAPYYAQLFKVDKTAANMQINDIIDYEINATAVSARYESDEWNRYDGKDEFLGFKAEVLRGADRHEMVSKRAIYQNDSIKFSGNADYRNSDGIRFISDEIIYEINDKIIRSDVNFTMTQNKDEAIGEAVKYDINAKKTYATKIKAKIEQAR